MVLHCPLGANTAVTSDNLATLLSLPIDGWSIVGLPQLPVTCHAVARPHHLLLRLYMFTTRN